MKIAIINPWFVSKDSIGGTERFVQDLAISMSRLNNDVDVYMLSGKSYKNEKINYISLNLFGKNVIADEYMIANKYGKLDNYNSYIRIATEIESKINIEKYDFIQLNSHLFLKCWENKKRIFTLHSNYEEFMILGSEEEFKVMISIMKKVNSNFTKFVSPSEFYSLKWSNLINQNVICIPHALNRERLICNENKSELLKKYDVNENLIKILLPSRLEMIQKRPDLILNALAILDKKIRKKFQVIFTGLDSQYDSNIKLLNNLANQNDINVKFIQFTEICEGYKIADIVLIPSKSESFGYSALESLSLGITTLLSRIPSLQEIVTGNSSGIIFGNNSHELANVLEKIIEDGKIKKNLVTDLWLEKYDLIKFAERYIEVFYEKE